MSLSGLFNNFALAVLLSTTTLACNSGRPEEAEEPAQLLVHNRKRITITHGSGLVETRMDGSLAWRNNNPGNLVYGEMAKRMGAIGRNSRMAVFPDYETGSAASVALLLSPDYINLTIDQAVKRRTPPHENDTPHVQKQIRKLGGFTGKEKIKDLSDAQLDALAAAIQRTEGWKNGRVVTDSTRVAGYKPKNPRHNS